MPFIFCHYCQLSRPAGIKPFKTHIGKAGIVWLDQYRYADITAVFQFTYAISMLFAGRIIDKLGTKKGYTWAIIIWSIGAIIHALAIPIGEGMSAVLGWVGIAAIPVSVLGFMFSRAVLAFGEAGNFPAAIKATAEYFPKKERSFATGIFNSGTNVGAILAPLDCSLDRRKLGMGGCFYYHWCYWFFMVVFLVCIFMKNRKNKKDYPLLNWNILTAMLKMHTVAGSNETEKVSWVKLLGYKQTWAFAFGKFMTDGVWWFFLFWLPAYLKDNMA